MVLFPLEDGQPRNAAQVIQETDAFSHKYNQIIEVDYVWVYFIKPHQITRQ